MSKQLLYYSYKYKGEYERIKKAVIRNEEWKDINYKGKYICIDDKEYPSFFKQLKNPPFVLFYEGNLNLLNKRMIGVVGSRNHSSYGDYCTSLLIENMNEEYGVVSGVAKGIDALSHLYAIKNNRSTIGVIGCGLNIVYPKENEILYKQISENYLLLSEYPYDTKPLAHHFPLRNRLIVAICEKLIVVEAKIRSGSMISVNEALELNKSIYVFPHNINNEYGVGCNKLIEQGANMLNDIDDIKEI